MKAATAPLSVNLAYGANIETGIRLNLDRLNWTEYDIRSHPPTSGLTNTRTRMSVLIDLVLDSHLESIQDGPITGKTAKLFVTVPDHGLGHGLCPETRQAPPKRRLRQINQTTLTNENLQGFHITHMRWAIEVPTANVVVGDKVQKSDEYVSH